MKHLFCENENREIKQQAIKVFGLDVIQGCFVLNNVFHGPNGFIYSGYACCNAELERQAFNTLLNR